MPVEVLHDRRSLTNGFCRAGGGAVVPILGNSARNSPRSLGRRGSRMQLWPSHNPEARRARQQAIPMELMKLAICRRANTPSPQAPRASPAFHASDVTVTAGQVSLVNLSLEISVEKEKVNVQEETPQVDVNPASNASAIVLTGKDLDALPDDPDELQSDLEALAGPSVGPNGGQLYIDGFTGGQLPPKSSIREIRINQNPFSAEYDKIGYGRIEIFTKPGTDKFHGQFAVEGNSSAFNSRNPYLQASAAQPYYSTEYMGNIGGPINKKASFFFNVQRRNIDEIAVVDAQIPDADLPARDYSASVPNPRTRTNLSPRIDYQLTPTNTLTARYQYYHDTQQNAGRRRLQS